MIQNSYPGGGQLETSLFQSSYNLPESYQEQNPETFDNLGEKMLMSYKSKQDKNLVKELPGREELRSVLKKENDGMNWQLKSQEWRDCFLSQPGSVYCGYLEINDNKSNEYRIKVSYNKETSRSKDFGRALVARRTVGEEGIKYGDKFSSTWKSVVKDKGIQFFNSFNSQDNTDGGQEVVEPAVRYEL